MKRLLNTLYITTQKSYLARDGETVVVRVERETKLRVPIQNLGAIICFGRVSCSPPLMELCSQNGVLISFLSERGRFFARVSGVVSGNVLLRREQYRRSDDEAFSAGIARDIVMAKIANCRIVILRAAREQDESPSKSKLESAARRLVGWLEGISKNAPLDTVRGCEGDAARTYFGVFDDLITMQKDAFFFRGRSRRPPLDNMNGLLSFLYTLLTQDVAAALEAVGLDPAVGYLHRDRPGRPGLDFYIMEEFRACIADRLALSLVNRKQVQADGFETTESGAVHMNDETRRTVLVAYQERKKKEIQHPFLNEKVAVGLLPHCQALLLARYLRNDLDAYPPFFWK